MSDIQALVRRFYDEIWNQREFSAAEELLAEDVSFRGSLGSACQGRSEFLSYVRSVTEALSGYCCEINEMVADGAHAAAKVTFSGVHTGDFLGYPPTNQTVQWNGAAFFTEKDGRLVDVWVLGDLAALTRLLEEQAHGQ